MSQTKFIVLLALLCHNVSNAQDFLNAYSNKWNSFINGLLRASNASHVQNEYQNTEERSSNNPKTFFDMTKTDSGILQDAALKTPEVLHKYGYPNETHQITTVDGYLLEVHRIPRPGAQPVLLMHGLLDSSATWLLMGPKNGLGYILYDLGYDVWMGNARGNRYSRSHKEYSPSSASFWDFSFHEIGFYDLPATIDYVLEKSGFEKIQYVAHSQGTTILWVMCSEKPEYNEKMISAQALAPVAFVSNMKSPFIRAVIPFLEIFQFTFNFFGIHEFMPSSELLAQGGQSACRDKAITQAMCSNVLFLIAGFNSAQLNMSMLPVILGHTPAGASVKQFLHFGQLVESGRFKKYNEGYMNNRLKYGQSSPPNYNLDNVRVPVGLYYSSNDWLVDLKDVNAMKESLPNVIDSYLVPYKDFNHLDFLWAMNGRSVLYDRVISSMKKIEEIVHSAGNNV